MHVTVDVETIIFAGQDDGSIVEESHIEALGMLDLGFERRDQLSILSEDGQVEVVVVVGNQDLASRIDANTDGVVGQTFAANLTQKDTFVAEDLDAVGTVVGDEDLLLIVDNDAIGEFQVF